MGIFGKARSSKHPLEDTLVWAVSLHIKEGREPLPPPLVGAYVKVFCRADSATLAAWAAIQAIEAMGFTVPENPSTVDQMRAGEWVEFISANWPELNDELPTQAEFYQSMADNRAVLGPIAGYEASSP